MTTSEVLRAARAHIERHGWCQNRLRAADGRVCMVGAVDSAAGESRVYIPAGEALGRAVGGTNRDGGPWPVRWNDDPERTIDEVLAAFDRAIAAEEAREQEHACEPVGVDAPAATAVPLALA